MSRVFPLASAAHGKLRVRDTFVVWEMEGYSIPEGLDPYSIKEKIKRVIKKDGFYCGEVSIWVYGADNTWSIALQDKFWEAGFIVYPLKGDKGDRLNMIITDVVLWTFIVNHPSNLLILSENKENIEQDPKFCSLREALENKGYLVASAQPETLINQEETTAVEEPDDSTRAFLESGYFHSGSSETAASESPVDMTQYLPRS